MKLLLTHVPLSRQHYYGARALGRLQELVEVTLHEGDAPLDPAGRDRGGARRRFDHRRPLHRRCPARSSPPCPGCES